jgi:hypothetical protein
MLSATFAPIPGTDISSSMEQFLMKTRGIVNKNKQQKHVAFYSVVRERVRSVDKLIGKWDGTGQGQVKGKGKDMGIFDKVPLTGGKSYYNKLDICCRIRQYCFIIHYRFMFMNK